MIRIVSIDDLEFLRYFMILGILQCSRMLQLQPQLVPMLGVFWSILEPNVYSSEVNKLFCNCV